MIKISEVVKFCQDCGWQANSYRHFKLAADLLTLAKLAQ